MERGTRLAGKVGIVTGTGPERAGAIGSGKATALLAGRQGAKVVVMDNVAAHAAEAAQHIEREGGTALAVTGDVTRAADCRAAVDATVERFGRLDFLVNNVAVPGFGDIVTTSEEEWDHTVAVILKGAMLMSKCSVPRMRDSGGGAVINIGSIGCERRGKLDLGRRVPGRRGLHGDRRGPCGPRRAAGGVGRQQRCGPGARRAWTA